MPTAGRLVALIMFAGLAWYASQLIKPLFPEQRNVGLFAEVNAVIGGIIGWRVAGSRANSTWANAISYGFTTMVALVFWALLLHSFGEMIRKSLNRVYEGPGEAIIGVFGFMYDYGMIMSTPLVWGTLVVGGIIAGLITEFFGRRFR
jgi:hypothetical protein